MSYILALNSSTSRHRMNVDNPYIVLYKIRHICRSWVKQTASFKSTFYLCRNTSKNVSCHLNAGTNLGAFSGTFFFKILSPNWILPASTGDCLQQCHEIYMHATQFEHVVCWLGSVPLTVSQMIWCSWWSVTGATRSTGTLTPPKCKSLLVINPRFAVCSKAHE